MTAAAKKISEALSSKMNAFLKEELAFFKTPSTIDLFKAAGIIALGVIIEKMSSKIEAFLVDYLEQQGYIGTFDINDMSQIKNLLKNDPYGSAILSTAADIRDDSIVSDAICNCESIRDNTEDFIEQKYEDFIESQTFEEINDIKEKIEDFIQEKLSALNNKIDEISGKLSNLKEKGMGLYSENMKYVSVGLAVIYVTKLAIDVFKNTDFPSTFRLKYVQKLLRVILASISEYGEEQWEEFKPILTSIDTLLIGLALMSTTYLLNKLISQQNAEEELKSNMCPDYVYAIERETPENSSLPSDFENFIDFDNPDEFSCPYENEEDIVPSEPYENKVSNFSCPIDTPETEQSISYESAYESELAVNAIIENLREESWKLNVNLNDIVNSKTIIATIGDQSVYSPINGMVSIINDGSIVLSDISDPTESELDKVITSLTEKYKTQNEIKQFLKDFEVLSLYPIMMKDGPITSDSSTGTQLITMNNGMYNQFGLIKLDWEDKKENYDKNIKKLTGEEKVKAHAENESLDVLKVQIDTEEDQIAKYMKTYLENSKNIASMTFPEDGEFSMVAYYAIELGLPLNAAEDSSILNPFRDQINLYTQQRIVIDGWKPEEIEDKIKELLKDLEKGVTNGNKWFKAGVEKYEERKKISDVKNWVDDIDPDQDLTDVEIEDLQEQIIYLYEMYFSIEQIQEKYMYFSIEQIQEKYKDLEESDNKQKIIEEGNYIEKYLSDLWIELESISNDIPLLEEKLGNLALLSKYYIVEVDENQYRKYDLTEDPDKDVCMPGGESMEQTKTNISTLKYWFKYMSFATLAHVLSPQHWGTGWPGPPTKIPFPTIYLPIKAIETNYGVIVIGLTITGVWFYPFVLFVNLTSSPVSPLGEIPPIPQLKNYINETKAKLVENLKDFRKDTLQKMLDNSRAKIKEFEPDLEKLTKQKQELKESRPPKTKQNREKTIIWNSEKAQVESELTKVQVEKWTEEKKYAVIESAQRGAKVAGNVALGAQAAVVEKAEKTIEKAFGNLDEGLEKIEKILSTTLKPMVLEPYTINFLFTIKNLPSPDLYKVIETDLDETSNSGIIDPILDKFKMNNEDFLKGPVSYNKSGVNTAMKALQYLPSPLGIKKKEAIPVYEDLKIINAPWALQFLYQKFVPMGGKCYGFPF